MHHGAVQHHQRRDSDHAPDHQHHTSHPQHSVVPEGAGGATATPDPEADKAGNSAAQYMAASSGTGGSTGYRVNKYYNGDAQSAVEEHFQRALYANNEQHSSEEKGNLTCFRPDFLHNKFEIFLNTKA